MPYLELLTSLKGIQVRQGITSRERLYRSQVDAELAPFRPNLESDPGYKINSRDIEVHLGSLNMPFVPSEVYGKILGDRAAKLLDGSLQDTVTAKDLLCQLGKSVGEKLVYTVWKGKYNPDGKRTLDLFDGFDTITEKEIASGLISEANKNLIVLSESITAQNACDILKNEVLYKLSTKLRQQKATIFVPQSVADAYNDSYQYLHHNLPYNDKYEKTFLEGSNNKIEIVVAEGKEDSKFLHIAVGDELVVGCDQVSNNERVNVGKYQPDTLTFEMRAAYGAQMATLHYSRFCAVQLAD